MLNILNPQDDQCQQDHPIGDSFRVSLVVGGDKISSGVGRKEERNGSEAALTGEISSFSNDSRPSSPLGFRLSQADVLLGRGKGSYEWKGNKGYQKLLASYMEEYNFVKRNKDKIRITDEIVATVKKNGGRFVGMKSKKEQQQQCCTTKDHNDSNINQTSITAQGTSRAVDNKEFEKAPENHADDDASTILYYEISDADARIRVSQALRHCRRRAIKKNKKNQSISSITMDNNCPEIPKSIEAKKKMKESENVPKIKVVTPPPSKITESEPIPLVNKSMMDKKKQTRRFAICLHSEKGEEKALEGAVNNLEQRHATRSYCTEEEKSWECDPGFEHSQPGALFAATSSSYPEQQPFLDDVAMSTTIQQDILEGVLVEEFWVHACDDNVLVEEEHPPNLPMFVQEENSPLCWF